MLSSKLAPLAARLASYNPRGMVAKATGAMEESRDLVSGGNGSGGSNSSSNRDEEERQHGNNRAGVVRAVQLTVDSGLLPDTQSVRESCLGLRNARNGRVGEHDNVAAPAHENIARIDGDAPTPDLEAPCATRDSQRPRRAVKVVFKPTRHPPSSYFKSRVAAAMATADEAAEMAEAVAVAAEAEEEAAAAAAATAAATAATAAAVVRQQGERSLLGAVFASFREPFGAGRGGGRADGDDFYDNDRAHIHDTYEPFPSAFVC